MTDSPLMSLAFTLPSPCIDGPGERTRLGYVRVWRNGKRVLAHRLAYVEAKGEIPAGLELDHLCRNRWCRNADHLEAVPHIVNSRRSSKPKLTMQLAEEIRHKFASGAFRKADLGRQYGVSRGAIGYIISGRIWQTQ